jgi:protein gp37
MAHRFQKERPDKVRLTTAIGEWTGDIYLRYDALDKPSKKREPTVYAVWNDLFHPDVLPHFIDNAWIVMKHNPQHIFIVITKRPKQATLLANEFNLEKLPNVWFLATTENQACLDERAQWVLDFPAAAVKGIILEPLLEAVDLSGYVEKLDWVIVGSETGPHHRPCNLEWIRSIVKQCRNTEVRIWVKAVNIDGRIIKKTNELPVDVRFRELPEIRA